MFNAAIIAADILLIFISIPILLGDMTLRCVTVLSGVPLHAIQGAVPMFRFFRQSGHGNWRSRECRASRSAFVPCPRCRCTGYGRARWFPYLLDSQVTLTGRVCLLRALGGSFSPHKNKEWFHHQIRIAGPDPSRSV